MNGKEKCKFLKGIRKRMAELNGIPYEPRECTYEGECTGMCPFCEKEAAELLAKLKDKKAEGTEVKIDWVGIETIEVMKEALGIIPDNMPEPFITPGLFADVYEESERMWKEYKKKRFIEEIETFKTRIDSFRGSNNPIMSEKDLREMRSHHEKREPLMGDIPSPFDEELRKEEMLQWKQKEEAEKIKREQMEPLMGDLESDEEIRRQR